MDLKQADWMGQLEIDQNAIVLDVRTEEECQDGMIPNAIHIDIYNGQEFINALEQLDHLKNYYVYCKAGGRSGQACQLMNQLGFENTYNLIGGMMNWNGAVVPPKRD